MTLISLEDAKAEVRKVVSDFRTRYDINYRLNNLPSIELEDEHEAEQTEPQKWETPPKFEHKGFTTTCVSVPMALVEDEPQTDCNKLINEVVKLDMSREDKFKVMELLERHCEKCKHYLFTDVDGYYCEHETYGQPCGYEPKDEPTISKMEQVEDEPQTERSE